MSNGTGMAVGGLAGLAVVAVVLVILGAGLVSVLPMAVAAALLVGVAVRERRG